MDKSGFRRIQEKRSSTTRPFSFHELSRSAQKHSNINDTISIVSLGKDDLWNARPTRDGLFVLSSLHACVRCAKQNEKSFIRTMLQQSFSSLTMTKLSALFSFLRSLGGGCVGCCWPCRSFLLTNKKKKSGQSRRMVLFHVERIRRTPHEKKTKKKR